MADTSGTQIAAAKANLTKASALSVKLLSWACGGTPDALGTEDYAAYDMFEAYVAPSFRADVRQFVIALNGGITTAPKAEVISSIADASIILSGVLGAAVGAVLAQIKGFSTTSAASLPAVASSLAMTGIASTSAAAAALAPVVASAGASMALTGLASTSGKGTVTAAQS